jgi:hypothetical protein
VASHRIIIPHGLAADVLRALQCRRWLTTQQVVEVVGVRWGVAYSNIWTALRDLWDGGEEWRLRRAVCRG